MLCVTIPIRNLFVDDGQEDRLVFKHMIEHKDVNAAIVFELTRITERALVSLHTGLAIPVAVTLRDRHPAFQPGIESCRRPRFVQYRGEALDDIDRIAGLRADAQHVDAQLVKPVYFTQQVHRPRRLRLDAVDTEEGFVFPRRQQ